jgi:transposase InsO family protein
VKGITTARAEVRAASNPTAPNRLWIGDVNFIPTDQGWVYLAVVLDCYTRRCIGWWLRNERDSSLLVHAVELAASRRWPSIGVAEAFELRDRIMPLTFAPRCRLTGLDIPGAGAASLNDLAVAEYFATMLRRDLTVAHAWSTRREARDAVGNWILAYYNPESRPFETDDFAQDLDEHIL